MSGTPLQLSEECLVQVSERIAELAGLQFPRERWPDLERGLGAAVRHLGSGNIGSLAEHLLASTISQSIVDAVASHLTVSETYFFRDKNSFQALRKQVLPELIRSRWEAGRFLRVWSAGCATGEEAYSLAILLRELIPNSDGWKLRILATDINRDYLRKAVRGSYSHWSFREPWVGDWEKWFRHQKDGRREVLPAIREMVTFTPLNLAQDAYPPVADLCQFDLIFCRNVLMYFAPPQAAKVVARLHACLAQGGWLVVSPTEMSLLNGSRLAAVDLSGAVLYRKDSARAEVSATVRVPNDVAELVALWPAAAPTSERVAWQDSPPVTDSAPSRSPAGDLPETIPSRGEPPQQAELACAVRKKEDAASLIQRARACADEGKLAEALTWCEQALAADPLTPGWHYLRAVILAEQDSLEEAGRSLQRALYLDPDFVLAHFVLGTLALRQSNLGKSRKHFKNVAALLKNYSREEILPDSEGITAGWMLEMLRSEVRREGGGEA